MNDSEMNGICGMCGGEGVNDLDTLEDLDVDGIRISKRIQNKRYWRPLTGFI
jgi:hypothetical protein